MPRAAAWAAADRTPAARVVAASGAGGPRTARPPSRRAPRAAAGNRSARANRRRTPASRRAAPASTTDRSAAAAPGLGRRAPRRARCERSWSYAVLVLARREQPALLVLLLLIELPRHDQVLGQLLEAATAGARVRRFGPAPEHLVLERAVRLPGAENLLHLAHHQLEHADLAIEDLEHVRLDRAAGGEVDDPHRVLLAEPVHPPDALLEPHRVPG